MTEERTAAEPGPQIALRQVGAVQSGVGYWSVEWEIENRGNDRIQILAARLPHGQFKSDEIRFEPPVELLAGRSHRFRVSVRCHEPSGVVTENAFVILDVIWWGKPWRVFARVRVDVNSYGKPVATPESITTQKVGFSGIDS
jgi:hypothetical protein